MEASDWIIVGIAAVLIVGGCGYQAFETFGSDVPADFYLSDGLSRAMNEAAAQAPKPGEGEFWRVAYLPMKGDPKARVTAALRTKLGTIGDPAKFRGPDPDYVAEELERDFKRPYVVASAADAYAAGSHLGVDAVVWGEVTAFSDKDDVVEVSFRATFEKIPLTKKDVPSSTSVQVTHRMSKSLFSLQYVRLRLGMTSGLIRIGLWFIIAAGLPFALYPIVMKVVSMDSNAVSGALWLGLVGAALAAALALNGVAFSAVWVILYLALVAGCGLYYLALLNAFQEA